VKGERKSEQQGEPSAVWDERRAQIARFSDVFRLTARLFTSYADKKRLSPTKGDKQLSEMPALSYVKIRAPKTPPKIFYLYGRGFAFKSQAFYLHAVATNLQMSSPCGRIGNFFTILNELICKS